MATNDKIDSDEGFENINPDIQPKSKPKISSALDNLIGGDSEQSPIPEIRDNDVEEELTDDDVEEEELTRLGKYARLLLNLSLPRWVIPVITISGVLIIALIISLVIGGNRTPDNHLKPDHSAKLADSSTHRDTGTFDSGDNDTESESSLTNENPREDNSVNEDLAISETNTNSNLNESGSVEEGSSLLSDSSLYAENIDSVQNERKYDDMIMAQFKDEYYDLLNAEITPDDIEQPTDYEYYNFLTEPIEPLPEEISIPVEKAWSESDSIIYEKSAIMVDTAAIFERIYTLEDRMFELVGHLNSSKAENIDLQLKIDRLKTAQDSLRAVEVRKLAKIIESMKPEKAAAMLMNRKSDQITELIFKVKPRTAAKLMDNLPVDKCSQVTGWVMKK
ncbi:hypothetical protein K9N50_06835 [bacterium]|nr:hypothetical protein [bacterium]